MHYEINVSKHGRHYFATHERSVLDIHKAAELYRHFKPLFPETEYTVSVIEFRSTGSSITHKMEDY